MFPVPEKYREFCADVPLDWYMLWVASPVYQTAEYPKIAGVHYWIPAKPRVYHNGDNCYRIFEPIIEGYVFVGLERGIKIADVEKTIRQELPPQRIRQSRTHGMAHMVPPATKVTGPSILFLRDMSGNYKVMSTDEVQRMRETAADYNPTDYAGKLMVGTPISISFGPFLGAKGHVVDLALNSIVASAEFNGRKLILTVARENFSVLVECHD